VADESVRIDQAGRDPAEQLDFLAAHDVGAIILEIGDAGDDGFAIARPDQRRDEFIDARRGGHVARVLPAAVRTDHACEQQRIVAEALPDFGNRRREAAPGHCERALVVVELFDAMAGAIESIGAAVGRAPIDGDEAFSPAHGCCHGP
jgi:hypothetical protein